MHKFRIIFSIVLTVLSLCIMFVSKDISINRPDDYAVGFLLLIVSICMLIASVSAAEQE